MSAEANIFLGDVSRIAGIDIDSMLASARTPSCEFYIDCYAKAAKEAEEKSDEQSKAVYRFLQTIVGFQTKFDTPSEPYVPMWVMNGKRSLIPNDLSDTDISAVQVLAAQAKDEALRARLYDLIWVLRNDYRAGMQAASSYVAAADQLDTRGDWTYAVKLFRRGMYLASRFGKKKDLFLRSADALIAAVRRSSNNSGSFQCCQLMRIALAFELDISSEFASIAGKLATEAEGRGDARIAKAYWEISAAFFEVTGDVMSEKAARLAVGESLVVEAINRTKGAGASFMGGAALLVKAIEELRQAGANSERVEELRRLLNEWQRNVRSEMSEFKSEVDITDMVHKSREYVRANSLPEALLKLAFGQPLSDPKELKDRVSASLRESPFRLLAGMHIVDQQGRTIARKESLFNLTGEELEKALEEEAFSHAANHDWNLRVSGFIEPAREQILNDHKPTFDDLFFIVEGNPFIPPGHRGIYLRGLHSGFHGDFLVASHLLTPQIENSIRYVLESHGVDVSNLMSDGLQPVKILGGLFGMGEMTRIFGEDLCFELRGCLNEKAAYDFRNRIAHGFVSENECYSAAAVNIWWLVLRICMTPFFLRMSNETDNAEVKAG